MSSKLTLRPDDFAAAMIKYLKSDPDAFKRLNFKEPFDYNGCMDILMPLYRDLPTSNRISDICYALTDAIDEINKDGKISPVTAAQLRAAFGIKNQGLIMWKSNRDPLVLDLNGDGRINTVGMNESGAYFDLDGDGFSEKTAWFSGGDGILFYDKNKDGIINDISELFGKDGLSGLDELLQYDSNNDGVIDANDEIYDKLGVWVDKNSDGVSNPDEIFSLRDLCISSINVDQRQDCNVEDENEVLMNGRATFTQDGEEKLVGNMVVPYDNINTVKDFVPIDPRGLIMPFMYGFGNVAHSYAAYSIDTSLLELGQEMSADINVAISKFDLFMARWTGLEKAKGFNQMSTGHKLWIYNAFTGFTDTQLVEIADIEIDEHSKGYGEANHDDHDVTVYRHGSRGEWVRVNVSDEYLEEHPELKGSTRPVYDLSYFEKFYDDFKAKYLASFLYQRFYFNAFDGIKFNMITMEMEVTDTALFNSTLQKYILQLSLEEIFEFFVHLNPIMKNVEQFINDDAGDYKLYRDVLNSKNVLFAKEYGKIINGSNADTVYVGDRGNNRFNGGFGNDTYVFKRGEGHDKIWDRGGDDRILFGEGITKDDLAVKINGRDLIIALKEEGKTFWELSDSVTMVCAFVYGRLDSPFIETLEFADGTRLDLTAMMNLQGTFDNDSVDWVWTKLDIDLGDGDDYISAGNYGNTIIGGKGNDTLISGNGNDTYIFNRGDGHDSIHDSGGNDRILFGEGITKDELVAKISGRELVICIKEEGKTFWELSDRIVIYDFKNIYHNNFSNGIIETLEFADGSKLDLTGIMSLQGTDENDLIHWEWTKLDIDLGDGDDYLYGSSYGDTIRGGKGNDNIVGGKGDDTYIYNRGDGYDTILDRGGNDRIILGKGITKDDLIVKMFYRELVVALKEDGKTFAELSDKIEISDIVNYYGNNFGDGIIETVEFADGTMLDLTGIMSLQGTDENDRIDWGRTKLDIDLGDGDDYLFTGDHGNTIRGGKGNDYIVSGHGDDTYIFNRGDGQDIIHDRGGDDTVKLFGIDSSEFGLCTVSGSLDISYGNDDHITFNGSLERIERGDGSYLTRANIDYIIQEIASFSKDRGVNFSSAHDVQKNEYLNNFIAAQWNAV